MLYFHNKSEEIQTLATVLMQQKAFSFWPWIPLGAQAPDPITLPQCLLLFSPNLGCRDEILTTHSPLSYNFSISGGYRVD